MEDIKNCNVTGACKQQLKTTNKQKRCRMTNKKKWHRLYLNKIVFNGGSNTEHLNPESIWILNGWYSSGIQFSNCNVVVVVNHFIVSLFSWKLLWMRLTLSPTNSKALVLVFSRPRMAHWQIHIYTNNMVYTLFTISKESRKNFNPRRDLNPGPRPQSKSDDLDRSAIGPWIANIWIADFYLLVI